jgi:hypothetical protein
LAGQSLVWEADAPSSSLLKVSISTLLSLVQEGENFNGIVSSLHPYDGDDQYNSNADEDKTGAERQRKPAQTQGGSLFDQQNNFYQIQKPLTNVD